MAHNNSFFKRVFPYVLIAILLLILIYFIVFILQYKNINSTEIHDLYQLIDSNNLNECNGLIFYDEKIDAQSMENTQKLCLAYKMIGEENYTNSTLKKYKKTDYCLSGSNEFRINEEKGSCDIFSFDEKLLNEKYYALFGSNIETNENFEISGTKICYFDEENNKYLCGDNIEQTIEIGWNPKIYRLLVSAKKVGDKIILTDYYLSVNNNICYLNNSSSLKNDDCTSKIADLEIGNSTIKKYGKKYVHTFVLKEDGKYYWYSSSIMK